MTGAFAVFGESTFEMLNCYFIFINYLYLRSTIATKRILNMYYYKVLKYLVVCLSVLKKKNRKRHQVRYRHCFDKNVGMKKLDGCFLRFLHLLHRPKITKFVHV